MFGRHVASGWHTAALTMRLWLEHGPQIAGGMVGLGVEELRWGPLVPGDRIRVEGEILEVRPSSSGAPRGVVRLRVRTLNQRDEEVQHMVPAILVPAREAPAPGGLTGPYSCGMTAARRRSPRGTRPVHPPG